MVCNNMLGKSIPVKLNRSGKQENRKGARFLDQVAGKPKREFLRKKRRTGGALPELSVPVTSRVYFSAAQLYSHLRGDGVRVFRDVYVNHSSRETHIFISLLNEREIEKGRSEEDKMEGGNQRRYNRNKRR